MSLYDPFAETTPSQRLQAAARRARLARIEGTAKPDTPIACLSASARTGPPAVKPELPAPEFSDWLERQDRKNPLPRPLWFSMEEEIDPFGVIPPKIVDIQHVVAKHFGITRHEMISARRIGKLILPRHIAMYFCRVLTLRPFPEIGRRFGNRDHTVPIYASQKIARLIKTDPGVAAHVEALNEKLGAA